MKSKTLLPILILLIIGVYAGEYILNTTIKIEQRASDNLSDLGPQSSMPDLIQRGPHGGWLLSEKDLRIEVQIFETGVPPQFRVYFMDGSGNAVPLNETRLTIKLHRLDRVDTIQFKPMGKYLLGDKSVAEPHSFEVKIEAQWKGETYNWEFSQIEARAELTNAGIKNANITLNKAGPAKIANQINLPGEIGLNEEKVVHIVPRLDGVVKRTLKDLGARVIPGEVLAIIESRELANAKINYLSTIQQVQLTKTDLGRETLLFKNTKQMLDLLLKELELEDIYFQLKDLQIGKSRELLFPAYAKMKLAKSVFLREKNLFEKGISSRSEFLQAEEGLKSSEAKYMALREKIDYDGKWAVRQKKRNFDLETLNLKTARQKLFALGLMEEEIETLPHQEDQDFSRYELKSPIEGVIIQKHLSTGEAVKSDDDVFLLADLSEVWVNIAIPVSDLNSIKLGQKVTVHEKDQGFHTKGKLTYLGSIIDEASRTVTGRVIISNPKSVWRPGTFVTVKITFDERRVPIAVPARAIQSFRNWSVVFVKYGNFFEARPLKLGKSDDKWTEVLQGLKKGELFADKNSFTIKAEIEKSAAIHDH